MLDEKLNPVARGEAGDLYIGGVGLSPGYWRDQESTDAAFILDPNSSNASRRIYKTGDLARVGDDGLVYFIGRSDSQIKSRGYRIELGEIETALNAIGVLEECAVVAVESGGFEGAAICCSYVPRSSDVTPNLLRAALKKELPPYMLPSRWMAFEKLPRNANDKIDRRAIKERFFEE